MAENCKFIGGIHGNEQSDGRTNEDGTEEGRASPQARRGFRDRRARDSTVGTTTVGTMTVRAMTGGTMNIKTIAIKSASLFSIGLASGRLKVKKG
jgi:hypothetical protein